MQKVLVFYLCCFFSLNAIGQNADSTWFVNNYTKKEVYIPMRDGIKLFTSFYIPKDQTKKHPFLITRTPYSCAPYGTDKYVPLWYSYKMAYAHENYIFVLQDVRGRYMSEGVFEDVRPFNKNKKGKQIDEASDTYDALDWMIKNIANNNGNAGVFGTSYPGFYSTEAALSGHPALKAVSPQAPVTDWFIGDDFHHKGVFFAMDGFSFYPTFVKDNYKFYLTAGALKNLDSMIGDSIKFWHEMNQHPDYDAWWQARNARVGLYNVKPAMLWVGGLFDAEDCYGAWNSFKATDKQSPQTNNKIVMGPWYHGQWSREGSYLGNVRFESNTSDYFQKNLEIPFFNYYLKGKGSVQDISKATIFFTGENKWRKLDQWPAANVKEEKLYLSADNKLLLDESAGQAADPGKISATSFAEYISDPSKPVPYTEDVHNHRTREYMTDDQRFASRRPDVLTFEMGILKEDVTVAGPVIANLLTSITTTDADFVVKLFDVFPDDFTYPASSLNNAKDYPMGGYQMLVRGEIMRGKFRNSFEKPEPFTPGKPALVKFELPDIAHTFKKGHRMMIQVQSTWFPLADRNPQKFTDIYQANDNDFQKATIRIYTGLNGSFFTLPVIR